MVIEAIEVNYGDLNVGALSFDSQTNLGAFLPNCLA